MAKWIQFCKVGLTATLFLTVAFCGIAQAENEYIGEGNAGWELLRCSDVSSCEALVGTEVGWSSCGLNVSGTLSFGPSVIGDKWVMYIGIYCQPVGNYAGKVFTAWTPITTCQGREAPPCDPAKYVLEDSDPTSLPCTRTNPCNPANGNKSQREADFLTSANSGLAFARQYNSKGAYKTGRGMAAGWRHTYSRELNEEPDRKPRTVFVAPAAQSSPYDTAAAACTSGWADIKATVRSGELANATASFSGGNDCKISMGGSTVAYFPVRFGASWAGFTAPSDIKTITRSNASSYKFELVGSDWVNQLNPALKLEASGSNWVFTDTDDTQETYDSNGKLISITYRNGQSEMLEYDLTAAQGGDDDAETLDKVTGQFGHTISFGYDSEGLLSTVTTPDGAIQYGYDVMDNLVSVTYPDSSDRQYVYEDDFLPNHLTGIIDEKNARFATWSYDTAGRAISSEHANGKEHVDLAYNTDGTTTLTMANGAVLNYAFATEQGERRLTSLTGDVCSTCPGGNIKDRSYDNNGFVAELTDWNSNVTKTARNARGLIETLTEAFGDIEQRVTTTQWHAIYRLPTKVTSSQNVTDYVYDVSGNVLSVTVSGGGKTRVWSFTYNANGQPLTIDGPRTNVSDVTTLEYYTCTTGNECGQLKSVTSALGHVTDYDSYDGAGRLMQMTDPIGLQTSLTYDSRGNVLTVTQTPSVGAARVTTMTYDAVGQLSSYSLPNGVILTYAYNGAHYLRSITDNLGNYIQYGTDVMGNPVDEETFDPNNNLSRSIAYTHDNNDRLDTVSSGGFTTDLIFDLVGNLTTETDSNNAVTQHIYDALNRLDTTTNALSGVTGFDYDDNDNLTQVVAPNGAATNFVYDTLDNLISETSADRGLLTYSHDDAGNRLTVTDARGVTATYSYDALNRLSLVSYPDPTENVTYIYDDVATNGLGRLSTISDQSGTITFAYDEFGNVISDQRQLAGLNYTTTYQYDDANNINSIAYPSGRVVDYVRDAAGQIIQVTSTKNSVSKSVASAASYDPFGPVTSLTYGNGVVFDYQYGLDNRITSIASTGIAGKNYTYDAAGNIAMIYDAVDADLGRGYDFDSLHRLTSESAPSGYAELILADSPLAYWRLGETSGSVAVDWSGNGYDIGYGGPFFLGQPGLVSGLDKALRLETSGSVGGYAGLATLAGESVTGVEFWFQTDSVANNRDLLSLNSSSHVQTLLLHRVSGRIEIWRQGAIVLLSDNTVSTNTPHHVALWYEAAVDTTFLMVDGTTQQNSYSGNLLAVTNPQVLVGAYFWNSGATHYSRMLGEIDEVAIYNTPVSAGTFSDRTLPLASETPTVLTFAYDANGNRSLLDDDGEVTTFGYQAQSNKLTSINSIALQHDLAGNRTADQGGIRTFSYNSASRLSEVFSSGVSIGAYVHNSLGQRSKKTANGTTVVYLYDLLGNLIAEHSDTGAHIRDYIWVDDKPVAQIDQGEVFSYLHFDHLGTPRMATNDSQTVVWRWDSDAFGMSLADEDPDGDSVSTTVNLRFPGQYYDLETGLHYNYFRTYHPSTGRYLESDPIGLGGGLNTYGYVAGNPLSYTDSFGLNAEQIKAMLRLAVRSQADLNVPSKVGVGKFPGNGSAITNPITRRITLDNFYLDNDLDCFNLQELLIVIVHESIHRTRPRIDSVLRPLHHKDIYDEARERVEKNDFLQEELSSRCECSP